VSIDFNADEIFQIGMQIEVNGQAFYETIARNSLEPLVKELFLDLSRWESEHIESFKKLRQRLPDPSKGGDLFDPNQELYLYIKATADSHVFVKHQNISELASKCKTPIEALEVAVAFEKDSVVFYTAMKRFVPEQHGKSEIDTLIDEEMKHIFMLTRKKKELETQT
jgi:rubrerythrin